MSLNIPVTNAWPERGASAMKLVKTRCRTSLLIDTLEALSMLLINSSPVKQCKSLVQNAARRWIDQKKGKKLPVNVIDPPNIGEIVIESEEQSTQTELTVDAEEVPDVESVDNYE